MADLIKPNGQAEDFGALIGFEATNRLLAVFGGTQLYVPESATEDHPIAKVVGFRQMQLLCEEWGAQIVSIPENEEFRRLRCLRSVASLIKAGHPTDSIASILGMSNRQVQRYRAQAEEIGLLPMIMTSPPGRSAA